MRNDGTFSDRYVRTRFAQCADMAQLYSDDPVTRNGAVLVGKPRHKLHHGPSSPVSFAANIFACPPQPGWADRIRTDREFKYAVVRHAETSAIVTMLRTGDDTAGADLWCLYAACSGCAKVIVEAGVARVHTLTDAALGGIPARWRKDVDAGRALLHYAGVEVLYYEDVGVNQQFLFDGRMVTV